MTSMESQVRVEIEQSAEQRKRLFVSALCFVCGLAAILWAQILPIKGLGLDSDTAIIASSFWIVPAVMMSQHRGLASWMLGFLHAFYAGGACFNWSRAAHLSVFDGWGVTGAFVVAAALSQFRLWKSYEAHLSSDSSSFCRNSP
jgi:hypothetical protein